MVANLGTIYGETDAHVNYTPSPSQNGWHEIQVRPKACGVGSWYPIQEVEVFDCSLSHYLVYPNPGENFITLSRTSKSEDVGRNLVVLNIKISSTTTGSVLKDVNLGSIDEKIDISSLPSGIYVVSIYENSVFVESLKLIVKK